MNGIWTILDGGSPVLLELRNLDQPALGVPRYATFYETYDVLGNLCYDFSEEGYLQTSSDGRSFHQTLSQTVTEPLLDIDRISIVDTGTGYEWFIGDSSAAPVARVSLSISDIQSLSCGPDGLVIEEPRVTCDEYSDNFTWADNCTIRQNGLYSNSTYTLGVQRLLACLGFLQPDAEFDSIFPANGDWVNAFTGEFNANVHSSVQQYQLSRGLFVDGIVGPDTWSSLQNEISVEYINGDSIPFGFLLGRVTTNADRRYCNADLFIVSESDPTSWLLADTSSADGSTTYIPFGIDSPAVFEDLQF